VAVIVLILACGVFVAVEFALVTVDRDRVEQDAATGHRGARLADAALRKLSSNLSAAQLGITLTSLVIGFLVEPTVATLMEPFLGGLVGENRAAGLSVVLALGLATAVQMVLGELVPKSIAVARPTRVAYALVGPLRVFAAIFDPLIRVLNVAANGAVRLLGIEPHEELRQVRSLAELELLIRSSGEEGTLEPETFTLLTRTLRFGAKTAADALVPRRVLRYLTTDATVAELVRTTVETGFSRFPVYRRHLDDVAGVVDVNDVYRVPYEARATTPVTELVTEAFVVPETRDLAHLLIDMQRRGAPFALVVDEYGGMVGAISREDVLEEIVGPIADEHDPAAPTLIRAEGPGEWLVDGGLHHDDVFEACGFELPEGDFETLAGFVLVRLGHIPDPAEQFVYRGWTVGVVAMEGHRIATIRLVAPSIPPENSAASTNGDTGQHDPAGDRVDHWGGQP